MFVDWRRNQSVGGSACKGHGQTTSADAAFLLVVFSDYNTTWLCKITAVGFFFFAANNKTPFIFPESLNGSPRIGDLLAIRIAELSQSLLFELSPPPLSSRPLTRLILQANWPQGWCSPAVRREPDEPVKGKGCCGSPIVNACSRHGLLVLITAPHCAWSAPRL